MENHSSLNATSIDQARPASSPNQSSLPTSQDSPTGTTSPDVESLSAHYTNAFDNPLSRPWSASPSYQALPQSRNSNEIPTPARVSSNPPSPTGDTENKHQVTTTLQNVDSSEKAENVSQNCFRSLTFQWSWEIVSCMLAIGTLVALVVTLAKYKGHPQPTLPYKVSINTLVSIFSTIIKGLMLVSVTEAIGQLKWLWYQQPHLLQHFGHFDQATRGPLGATRLLWTLKMKHLASLGAFITVITVALDPFTQAVVQLYSCNVVLPSINATIPRSNNYTNAGLHTGAGTADLNQPMQNAIYNGVYNSANTSQTSFECSSGNCTFPTYEGISYQSIGVCSQCADVSESLSKTCTVADDITSCKINLPTFSKGCTFSAELLQMCPLESAQDDKASLSANGSLGHFSMIMVNASNTESSNESYPLSNYFGLECALYGCVKSYSTTVKAGSLTESIINESLNLQAYNPVNATYVVPSPCVVNGSLITGAALEGHHPNNDSWQEMELNGSSTYVLKECVYEVSPSSLISLTGFFSTFFSGAVYGETASIVDSSGWLTVPYASGNGTPESINTVIEGIATSMTNHMRQNGQAGNSDPAYGIVFGTETCVGVEWGWIAFPAATIALAALFLIFTIIKSWTHPGKFVWKSGALPVLYHGLDSQSRGVAAGADQTKDMERYSTIMTVRLQRTDEGWSLVDSGSSTEVMEKESNDGNGAVQV